MKKPVLAASNDLQLSKDPNTSPEILAQFANDKYDPILRGNVAKNPSAPQEILVQLANDKDWWVRASVAKNPNAWPEILAELANDEKYTVREDVAESPYTPQEILVQLANDKHYQVRLAVAKNPNTPASILADLANDESRDIKRAARQNPNTPKNRKSSAKKSNKIEMSYSDYDEEVWQAFLDDFMSKYPDTEIDGSKQGSLGYVSLYPDGFEDSSEYYYMDESDISSVTKELYEAGAAIDEDAVSEIWEVGMWKDVEYDEDNYYYYDE